MFINNLISSSKLKFILLIIIILISGCVGPLENVGPFGNSDDSNQEDISENNTSSKGSLDSNVTGNASIQNETPSINNSDLPNSNNEVDQVDQDKSLSELVNGTSWLIVDPNNPENYNNIQNALNQASDYFTILVYPGNYSGNIIIRDDIQLIGIGNASIVGGNYGLKINSSSPVIKGFEIAKSKTGITADTKRQDWVIKDTYIHDTRIGIDVTKTLGRWDIKNVVVEDSKVYGLDASTISTEWSIENSRFTQNKIGISMFNSGSPEYIRNIDVSSNSVIGLRNIQNSGSKVNLEGVFSRKNVNGAEIDKVCDERTCEGRIESSSYLNYSIEDFENKEIPEHIRFSEVKNLKNVEDSSVVTISGQTSKGVKIYNNIKITGYEGKRATISRSRSEKCIEAVNKKAKFKISNLILRGCSFGLDTRSTTGNWEVDDLIILDVNTGLNAVKSKGDWTANDITVSNSKTAVRTSQSKGRWIVLNSYFIENYRAIYDSNTKNGKFRYNSIYSNEIDLSSSSKISDLSYNFFNLEYPKVKPGSDANANFRCKERNCPNVK